jgi:hypothetical protein
MFNANLFANDDDIFDDDKSLSDAEAPASSNFGDSNRKEDFNKAMRAVIDILNKVIKDDSTDIEEARKILNYLKDVHGIELSNFIANFRIKLACTILNCAGSWVEEYLNFHIPRSVVYTLDSLTDNRFSIVDKFFNVELENAKRIIISRFLTTVFLSKEREKTDRISDIITNGLDFRYVKTYYEALRDINDFTISQNNGLYEALGQELDLPCNQKILDGEEIELSTLSSQSYSELRFSQAITPNLRSAIGEQISKRVRKSFSDDKQ